MLARADWDTVRVTPWVDKTAMVMCDLYDVDTDELIEVAPRTILRRQVEAAAAPGLPADGGQRDRVLPVPGHLRRGPRQGLSRPAAALAVARGLPRPADDQGRVHPRRRSAAGSRRRACRSSSARARPARASTRSTSTTPRPSRWPTATACTRPRRRRSPHFNGRSISFMAKYDFNDTGSSCHIHSQPVELDGKQALFEGDHDDPHQHERAVPALPRRTDRHRARVQPAVGTDDQQLQAVPAGLVGADRHRLGRRQPHARLPHGRPRQGHAGSSAASPAATPTATSPSPARSPAGCTASATSCRSASRSTATATRRPTSTASRGTSPTRSRCGRARRSPSECFGDDVHHHILTMAKAEWQAFNQTVTDWELRRYWERI